MNSYATETTMSSTNPRIKYSPKNPRDTTINLKDVPGEVLEIGKYNYKVSEKDKQIVVALFASGLTPSETIREAREQYNITIGKSFISHINQTAKWKKIIEKIKSQSMADLSSIGGSFKKVRLMRADKVYEKAIEMDDFKNSLQAIDQQRKEMEGDGTHITMNQFNFLSDEELAEKQKSVMKRIELLTKGVSNEPTPKTITIGNESIKDA